MPKIFEYFGFIFYFYSNEHEPIHVHVMRGARESIFELIINDGRLAEIRVRVKKGITPLTSREIAVSQQFIDHYANNIIEKWIKFFVLKQQIRSTKITKEL